MNVPSKIYFNLTPNTTQEEAQKAASNEDAVRAREEYRLSNEFLTFLENSGKMPITLDNGTIIEVPFETTKKYLKMAPHSMKDVINEFYYSFTNIHPDLKPLIKGKSLATPDDEEYIAQLSNTICSDGNTSHYNSMRSDYLVNNDPGHFTMIGMFGDEIWFVLTFFINKQERNYTFSIDGFCANNDLHNKIKGSGIGVRMILELFKQFNQVLEGPSKFEYCTLGAVPKAVKWWHGQFGFIDRGIDTGLHPMDLELANVPSLSASKIAAPDFGTDSKAAPASSFESITGKRGNTSNSSNKLKKFASATVDSATVDSATVDSATLDPLDLNDFFTLEELRGQLFEGPNEKSEKSTDYQWPNSDDEFEEGGGQRKSKRRSNKRQTIKKLKIRRTRRMKNNKRKTRRRIK